MCGRDCEAVMTVEQQTDLVSALLIPSGKHRIELQKLLLLILSFSMELATRSTRASGRAASASVRANCKSQMIVASVGEWGM